MHMMLVCVFVNFLHGILYMRARARACPFEFCVKIYVLFSTSYTLEISIVL
jgi:hypothetical protein